MAVKISVDSLVNYGAPGSPYGSEILLVAAAGPLYMMRSVALLASQLPTHGWIILAGTSNVDVQYTADSGATWRSMLSGSSTYVYLDTGGSIRVFNNTPASVDVRFVADRASN